MISVICAYNNAEILHKMLVPSLEKQTCRDFELISVNAKEHGFTGAAQTLNYGASVAKGEILVFVHQDIELLSETFIDQLNEFCTTYDFGVAGVAGGVAKKKKVYSSVTMDSDHRIAGERATQPMEVDTLDECLFFVKRDRFKGFTDYGTWHFYAVEYALRCKLGGEKIMLFPLEVYHLSPGW